MQQNFEQLISQIAKSAHKKGRDKSPGLLEIAFV